MIGIVSFREDPHADLVEAALREGGFSDFIRLDLERTIEDYDLTADAHGWRWSERGRPGPALTSENATTVWWRRAGRGLVPHSRAAESHDVDRQEGHRAAMWAVAALPRDRFPLGHPDDLIAAENKILQMQVAAGLGFRLPETLLSTDRRALKDFAAGHPALVVKPLRAASALVDGRENHLAAACTDAAELTDLLAQDREPLFLQCQERVPKTADVRVLSLPGGRHHAFEIATATLPDDEVDWRVRTLDFRHRPIAVPDPIRDLMDAYLRAMNLMSGSFDFALTESGGWVFLECNPNGQWLWLELKTGVELAREVASILVAHHG